MLKNLLSFLWLFSAFSSCSWNRHDTNVESPASTYFDTPVLHKLPSDAIQRYNDLITASVDSIFKKNTLNGSILVAKDGNVLFERYEGYQHYRIKQAPIDALSPFHLASVSKTLTSTAILQLYQNNLLNINSSVATYLKNFPLPDITVSMLLNHRSGLPNYVHYMERLGWDRKRRVTNQDVLNFIIERHKDIDIGRADRNFNYSNTNYALLALIIERVSGLSFSSYLENHFFKPLGMVHSYVFSVNDLQRAMPSFFRSGRPYAFDYLDLVYGDKNIYSTVQDLQKFEFALTEGKILNSSILEQAYKGYSNEKPGVHNYGLGWRLLHLKNGKRIIYHNGWWHGNRTAFYRLLDEKVTIIALCNNDATAIYSVKRIANIFGPYFPASDFKQAIATPRKTNKSNKLKGKKKVQVSKKKAPSTKKTTSNKKAVNKKK